MGLVSREAQLVPAADWATEAVVFVVAVALASVPNEVVVAELLAKAWSEERGLGCCFVWVVVLRGGCFVRVVVGEPGGLVGEFPGSGPCTVVWGGSRGTAGRGMQDGRTDPSTHGKSGAAGPRRRGGGADAGDAVRGVGAGGRAGRHRARGGAHRGGEVAGHRGGRAARAHGLQGWKWGGVGGWGGREAPSSGAGWPAPPPAVMHTACPRPRSAPPFRKRRGPDARCRYPERCPRSSLASSRPARPRRQTGGARSW